MECSIVCGRQARHRAYAAGSLIFAFLGWGQLGTRLLKTDVTHAACRGPDNVGAVPLQYQTASLLRGSDSAYCDISP